MDQSRVRDLRCLGQSAAPTTEVRGSGLGLSLARELARAMGGDLVLAVAARECTEFELTLRAAG